MFAFAKHAATDRVFRRTGPAPRCCRPSPQMAMEGAMKRSGGTLDAAPTNGAAVATAACRRRAANAVVAGRGYCRAVVGTTTATAADTCCFRGVAPTIPHKSDVLLVDQSGLPPRQMTGGPADLEGPGGQLNGYALHPLIIVEGCHVRRRLGSIWIGRGGWSMEDGAVGAGCARSATSRRRGGTLPPSAPARVRDCCC